MLILCVSLLIVVLDQWTKVRIQDALALGDRVVLIPGFLNLTHVQNTGAAWGVMQGLSHWLALLSIVMIVLLVVFRRHFILDTPAHRLVMGIMIGGVWGNLLDRVRLGYVVDFVDVHWGARHFPAFNVADAAICVGVGLYFVLQFLDREQDESSNKPVFRPANTAE